MADLRRGRPRCVMRTWFA